MTNNTQQIQQKPVTTGATKEPFRYRAALLAVLLGALAFGVVYAALPDHVTIFPNWLPLVLEAGIMIPAVFSIVMNRPMSHLFARILMFTLLAVITIALMGGVILFVGTLTAARNLYTHIDLLRTSALHWAANVLVFALWYWEIDGGGPRTRHLNGYQAADFMFPQQADGDPGHWSPHFIDYVFVAFTGATAFSPTDTYPLTRVAKLLMMVEALNSIAIVVIIIGRLVNIL